MALQILMWDFGTSQQQNVYVRKFRKKDNFVRILSIIFGRQWIKIIYLSTGHTLGVYNQYKL